MHFRKMTTLLISVLCVCAGARARAASCSDNEKSLIAAAVARIETRASALEAEIDAVRTAGSRSDDRSPESAQIRKVLNVVRCMERKLPSVKFACQPSLCDKDLSVGGFVRSIGIPGILTIKSKTINLCVENRFNLQGRNLDAAIYHELSHQCGTNDSSAAYATIDVEHDFYDSGTLASVRDWSKHADHYRWWYTRGFCLPGHSGCY